MSVDVESTKLRLIELIMSINDDTVLTLLEEEANKIKQRVEPQLPDVSKAVRPLRSNVSLEEIKQEQNYTPVSYQEYRSQADALELHEPIEELLSLLD
jgi:hypothetical protein